MQPHIDGYRFGRIEIDGTAFTRDVLIVGGRVVAPWWRQAGGHVFAPADLQEVLTASPEVVVLGTGYLGMVSVRDELLGAFADAGCEVVSERTPRAVTAYNELCAARRNVAAALHLTC
jgi:hypothetical protein